MSWDEAEHPRDKIGRFTFKNGGADEKESKGKGKESKENKNYSMSPFRLGAEITVYKGKDTKENSTSENIETKTPAEILYGKSKNQEKQQKEENGYKKILLDTLGNLATAGDILLGKKEDLERKIEERGLGELLKQKTIEAGIKFSNNKLGNWAANKIIGPDAAGMLDLAQNKQMQTEYTKNAAQLKNFNDIQNEDDKKYMIEKLYEQFSDYTDITNIENIKGYNFSENSEPSQRMAQNEDFKKAIKQNKEKILKGESTSGNFPSHGILQKDNLHNALGHFDIRNGKIDEQGNLHVQVYDTYDFNKENKGATNQAGLEQMHKGNLVPYFTIHDILIPKDELDKIWNKG